METNFISTLPETAWTISLAPHSTMIANGVGTLVHAETNMTRFMLADFVHGLAI